MKVAEIKMRHCDICQKRTVNKGYCDPCAERSVRNKKEISRRLEINRFNQINHDSADSVWFE